MEGSCFAYFDSACFAWLSNAVRKQDVMACDKVDSKLSTRKCSDDFSAADYSPPLPARRNSHTRTVFCETFMSDPGTYFREFEVPEVYKKLDFENSGVQVSPEQSTRTSLRDSSSTNMSDESPMLMLRSLHAKESQAYNSEQSTRSSSGSSSRSSSVRKEGNEDEISHPKVKRHGTQSGLRGRLLARGNTLPANIVIPESFAEQCRKKELSRTSSRSLLYKQLIARLNEL